MSQHVFGKRWPGPHQRFPVADTSGLAVLAEVDPRGKLPPVFDQLQIGSCTANATAAAFQYDAIVHGADCGELSRRWIYHFEKALEHTLGQGDTGAIGHDAFTVAKHGIPDESRWPYSEDIAAVEAVPPDIEPRAYKLMREVRAPAQTMQAVKQVLSNQQTVAIGFVVYESFESDSLARNGIMPMPAEGEAVLGGHEVLVVGYTRHLTHYALVRNSWGEGWGEHGYFYMPWAFLLDRSYCSDFRTIKR